MAKLSEAVFESPDSCYKESICFQRWKFVTKVVIYFNSINKLSFCRVVRSSLHSSVSCSLYLMVSELLELSPSYAC